MPSADRLRNALDPLASVVAVLLVWIIRPAGTPPEPTFLAMAIALVVAWTVPSALLDRRPPWRKIARPAGAAQPFADTRATLLWMMLMFALLALAAFSGLYDTGPRTEANYLEKNMANATVFGVAMGLSLATVALFGPALRDASATSRGRPVRTSAEPEPSKRTEHGAE